MINGRVKNKEFEVKVLNFFKICGVSFFILLSPVGLSQSKQDVSLALDQMQASGSFSHEQIDAARKQLMNMDESSYCLLYTSPSPRD